MGCDGGTIPKRDELVRTKKKPEQKDKNSERAFRWKHCAASQQRLQPPVVACELGRLYNKEAVLESLLNKAEGVAEVVSHIRTLRDVKELQLTENPAMEGTSSSAAEVGDGYIDVQKSKWICPVSAQEMNGTFKFSFIWSCGCVLSDKAIKELRKANVEASECLRCQKTFNFDDVISINPTDDDEIERQAEKMANRRLMAKKNKKSSSKKNETSTADAPASASTGSSNGGTVIKEEVTDSSSSKKRSNGRVSPGTSKSKLNGTSDIPAKKSKLSSSSSTTTSVIGSKLSGTAKPNDYSVLKDPNASEAYKSLFTSHSTAQNQQKAHWVTYNPFYN